MHFKKDHQQSHNKAKHAHIYSDQEYSVYMCTYACPTYIYIYIYRYIYIFRCFLSSVLPLRSVGRSNFDKGRHNSNNYVDSKTAYN